MQMIGKMVVEAMQKEQGKLGFWTRTDRSDGPVGELVDRAGQPVEWGSLELKQPEPVGPDLQRAGPVGPTGRTNRSDCICSSLRESKQ